jgi:hypothetical protein
MAAVTLPIVTTYNDKGVTSAQTSLASLAKSYIGAGVASQLLIKGVKHSVMAASDLQETVSKNRAVFGSSAQSVEDFAKTAASTFGQSQQQALDAASTFALFGKSAGLSAAELVNFSTDFTVLASDLASFSNTSPEEAILAIGAALRGEAEPIRKYNVLLNENTLKERARTLGIYKGTAALTSQQKILATQAEIYAQTSIAQGDFDRTSDGLANKTRTLNSELEDLSGKLGTYLLPVVEDATTVLTKLATAISDTEGKSNKLTKSFGFLVQNVGPLALMIKGFKAGANILHLVAGALDNTTKATGYTAENFKTVNEYLKSNLIPTLTLTAEELAELERKQKAADKAAKDHAKTLRDRVSTAVKGVKDNLADAQKQLTDFADATRETIVGYASLSEAVKTQSDADAELSDALKNRKDAYAQLAKLNLIDDAERYAEALQKVADAENNVATAQTTRSKSNYGQIFAKQIADAKLFSERLQFLVTNQGLGKAGLQQLLNLGVEAGSIVADELITGASSTTTKQINEGLAGLSTAAGSLGLSAGNAFFGPNVAAGQSALSAAQNYQITVNAGLVSNPATVGRDIIEAIKAAERLSGQVFVSA